MRKVFAALTVAVAMPWMPWAGALAAPQALGLLATGPTPTELTCEDGVCSAEFSAFCLQQDRTVPKSGTAYRAVDGSPLRFVVTDASGVQRGFAAQGLTIRSVRGFAAVVVSIPEAVVKASGVASSALSVVEPTVLAPQPLPGDPIPQTPRDIARAAAQLQEIGSAPVDDGGTFAQAFRGMMAMVNALPVDEESAGSGDGGLARQVLDRRDMLPEARAFTTERLEFCEARAGGGWVSGGLRSCLQTQHDAFVGKLNRNYWNALKPGS